MNITREHVRCGMCFFFDGTFCRVDPPRIAPTAVAEGEAPDRGVWPTVAPCDFCGKWRLDPMFQQRTPNAAPGIA